MYLAHVTFDAADPRRLATFWSEATGQAIAAANDSFATLALTAAGVELVFLKVPEGKTTKNRVHLDFHMHSREAEVARLLALGATLLARHDEAGVLWTTLQDPEGNELCVVQE